MQRALAPPQSPLHPFTRSPFQHLWLVGSVLVVVLLGLPSLLYPFHPDQAIFAYIGDRWLHGQVPYRDMWDIKPPGVYAIYAIAQFLFGRSMAACRIMDLVGTAAAAAGLYMLMRRRFQPSIAALAPVLFGIAYFTGFGYQDSAQAESLAAPGTVFFIYAVWRMRRDQGLAWPQIAGFLLGGLTLIKTTYLLYGALALLALWREGDRAGSRWTKAAAFLSGGVLLPIAALIYLWHCGAMGTIAELIAAERAYGSAFPPHAFSKSLLYLWMFVRRHLFVDLLAGLAVVSAVRNGDRSFEQRIAAAWLGIAALTVAIQWRFHTYHFLVLLPPLSLMAAALIGQAWTVARSSGSAGRRTLALGGLLILLLAPVAGGATRFGLAISFWSGAIDQRQYWGCFTAVGWYPFANTVAVADYIKAHARPEEQVVVYDNDPAVYFLTGRVCPTRHVSVDPLVSGRFYPAYLRAKWSAEFRRDVEAARPTWFITAECPFCSGFASKHVFAPERIHIGADDYAYVTHITHDRIYRRITRLSAR